MLANFKNHSVTVMHDSGLYRHLRCRVGESFCMGFDVVTWPGYLSISGDMGCFVFTRVNDMFTFFRGHEDEPNLGYWHEKLAAHCSRQGSEEFSREKFEQCVESYIEGWDEGSEKERVREELIESDLSDCSHDELVKKAMEAGLDSFYEYSLTEFTIRFKWACHAIPWAIMKYDKGEFSRV